MKDESSRFILLFFAKLQFMRDEKNSLFLPIIFVITIEVLAFCRVKKSTITMLYLITFGNDADVSAALCAGTSGFLLKEMNGDDPVLAIRGEAQFKPQLHQDIVRRLISQVPMPKDPF
jgi:DNA-binding NarL/FixJ family response regulator